MIRSFLESFGLTRKQWALVSLVAVYITVIAPINVYFFDEIMKFFGLENASIRESPKKFIGMLIFFPPILILLFLSIAISEILIDYFNLKNKIESWMNFISYLLMLVISSSFATFLDIRISQNLKFFVDNMQFLDISKIQNMTFTLSVYCLFYTFLLFMFSKFVINVIISKIGADSDV